MRALGQLRPTSQTTLGKMSTVNHVEIIERLDRKVTVTQNYMETTKLAQELATAKNLNENDNPFFVVNISDLIDRFNEWKAKLPRVQPFYAVKCNNDPVILWVLAHLGCGFDCASRAEMDMVLKKKMVKPENIVYANPCKTRSFVHHANQVGVRAMTFDNKEELAKIKEIHGNPHLLLRIGVSDTTAVCQLSTKYGCDPEKDGPKLLKLAKEMGLEVIGIAFHVGSGCRDPVSFRRALKAAKTLFDTGIEYGHNMGVLDIGGGFPGYDSEEITFDEIVNVINPALDEHFPASLNVKIIAEPGRFFATHPVSLVTNITSAVEVSAERITGKAEDAEKPGMMYYMNDGVYGSFNCIFFDHYHPKGAPLFEKKGELVDSTIWGPTCDGLDQVEVQTRLPRMAVGDWLLYHDMGAYTNVAASKFNGFEPPKTYYFVDKTKWALLSDNARFGA
ncbi:unnamed protein product [Bursaphelenchus xylophilus]|uniref:ornithine decarboxylase n=2 Tax=Bursaphelenchus xylophilus TaxID=6326 RepID=A0A7I8X594_BURXY|nr:unnamed protein product [Bursaphelenchus xylophilus]CAG9122538.1 unnamed protein product [Bursaphelenchus xylophilus]